MKRVLGGILLSFAAAMSALAESPLNQGVYTLGGSISYESTDSDDGDLTSYSIAPSFRYFVQPSLAIGASVMYRVDEMDRLEFETWSVGPLVRYYFPGENVRPFFELQYSYEDVEAHSKSPGVSGVEADTTATSISFGTDIFIARNVALEPALVYTRREVDYPSDYPFAEDATESEIAFTLGIAVFIY